MTHTIEATLAFSKRERVGPDPKRNGLLRNTSHALTADPEKVFDQQACRLHDLGAPQTPVMHLEQAGFETINLSALTTLQSLLERVRVAGQLTQDDAAGIRRKLKGRSFKLGQGKRLRLLHIASEGLIMRKAGPDGLSVMDGERMSEMNGHDGAVNVHADQDVRGTPLRQMMRGAAPWILRHDSPDGRNRLSPLCVVNIWIPLQQISRPLTLMDTRSLDRRRHQACYAFSTSHFMQREDGMQVNDLWTCLHDPSQAWYFHSQMDAQQAYVFDTLGTPHGSVRLPGEAQAAQAYQRLEIALQAARQHDAEALKQITPCAVERVPESTTAPLRQAVQRMSDLLKQAANCVTQSRMPGAHWQAAAQLAMDAVVRKSIELRALGFLSPVWRPGAAG